MKAIKRCLPAVSTSHLLDTWIRTALPGGCVGASLVARMVKDPPATQEIRARSLGWEDPQEKGMATHSSILAWRTPWTDEPGGLLSGAMWLVLTQWISRSDMYHFQAKARLFTALFPGKSKLVTALRANDEPSPSADISWVYIRARNKHFLF